MSLIFNNEDSSIQAGNVKIHGANVPSVPITGDIWVSGDYIYFRSNDSTWRLEQNSGWVQVEENSSSSSSEMYSESSSSSSSSSSEMYSESSSSSSSSSSELYSESSSSSSSSSSEMYSESSSSSGGVVPLEAVVGTAVVGTNTVG